MLTSIWYDLVCCSMFTGIENLHTLSWLCCKDEVFQRLVTGRWAVGIELLFDSCDELVHMVNCSQGHHTTTPPEQTVSADSTNLI